MKKHVIRSIITYLIAFFTLFGIKIFFAYLWGDDLDVPEALSETIFDCIIFVAVNFYLQRKRKLQKANDNTDKTE